MSHTYNFLNVSLRLILQREDRYRDISEVKQVLHYTWLAKESSGKQDTAAHNRLIDKCRSTHVYLSNYSYFYLSILSIYVHMLINPSSLMYIQSYPISLPDTLVIHPVGSTFSELRGGNL